MSFATISCYPSWLADFRIWVTGIVTILLVGQVKQGTLRIHPHLDKLLIGYTILLCLHQTLIGLGANGDAPPTLKLKIVNEQIDTGIALQYVVRKFEALKMFQASNGKSCLIARILHKLNRAQNTF